MNLHNPSNAQSVWSEASRPLVEGAIYILRILWTRKAMVGVFCLLGVLLAGVGKFIVGPSYTATAVLQPDLRGPETAAPGAQVPTIDIATLTENQARIIQSDGFLEGVVTRLGLDKAPVSSSLTNIVTGPIKNIVTGPIKRLFTSSPPSLADLAAATLKQNLSILNGKRSSLILVSYTAPSAEQAASVANAVASEFIRNAQRQTLVNRKSIAERTLASLTSTYGQQHPLIRRAKEDVTLALTALQREEEQARPLMSAQELAATGLVVPAKAITIPSGMSVSIVLILGFVSGLLTAIATTFLLDRQLPYR